ncbi:hypothetical protein HAP94_14025 [Acidithiobacillus ferrivorans]|nr:hypothetical protein [Acidithiobacillus ferrivorans]
MGTIDISKSTLPLKPNGHVEVTLWTTTGDAMDAEDGCMCFEMEADDGTAYALNVLNAEYSERWERLFLAAFANHPDFRKQFQRDPGTGDTGTPVIAAGKKSLPELPKGTTETVTRKDVGRLKTMGGKAQFKDYVALRSGRDVFSSLHLDVLRAQSGISELIEGAIVDDASRAKAYRWVARGLPDWMAVRKVKTDLEIAANIHPGKGQKRKTR